MGTYGYYEVLARSGKRSPLDADLEWLERVARTHGDGEPRLIPRNVRPTDAKRLGLELSVTLIGNTQIEDAAEHFARTAPRLRATPEVELRYRNKGSRPDYELTAGYFNDGTIELDFQSTIFRKLDRQTCKSAAETFYRSAAAHVGVELDCHVTLRPPKEWPRERTIVVQTIVGGTATVDMGTRLRLEVPRARQRFRKLLARVEPPLTRFDLTVRGNHAIAAAEFKRLGGPAKREMIVDHGPCAVDWAALRKLGNSARRVHVSVEVPLKIGEIEVLASLDLKDSKHQLELVRKWGLADDEIVALERELQRKLAFRTEV